MENRFRTIDIGHLKSFAKGGTGECYRIDRDTILKLYYEGFPTERILTEKECARAALIADVPTAISLWLVQAGDRQGILFELVQGNTLSEEICEKGISCAREMGRAFAGIARKLHEAEVKKTDLPLTTLPIRKAIQGAGYMPDEVMRRVLCFMDDLDTYLQYVHGDFHLNNVIMAKDGPVLIDMGGFSIGCPMFDLATCYYSLFELPEALTGGRNSFNHLTLEEAREFWKGVEEKYFPGGMDPASSELLRKVVLLKKMRFEALYGDRYPLEYCQPIREEVLSTFSEKDTSLSPLKGAG